MYFFTSLFVISLTLAIFFTKSQISMFSRLNLYDIPRGRHIHESKTPTSGGISIVISFLITFLIYCIITHQLKYFLLFSIPTILILTIGTYDDQKGMRSRTKLFWQIVIGVIAYFLEFKITFLLAWQVPEIISLGLTVLWFCLVLNAFNLIDGIDGLAAGIAIIACTSFGVWTFLNNDQCSAIIMLILIASLLGFLRYNFEPAKIFMGDAGSMAIGTIIALVGIKSFYKDVMAISLAIPFLAIGVPLFDLLLAVWRRVSQRILANLQNKVTNSGIMSGDAEHLHHRFLRKTNTHKNTAFFLYGIALFFSSLIVIILLFQHESSIILFFLLLLLMSSVLRRLAHIESWNSLQIIEEGLRYSGIRLLIIWIHPFVDVAIIITNFYLFVNIFKFKKSLEYDYLLLILCPILLVSILGKIYQIYWIRAEFYDIKKLFKALFIGFGIGYLLTLLILNPLNPLNYYLFVTSTTFCIIVERCFIIYLHREMFEIVTKNSNYTDSKKVLIYGCGEMLSILRIYHRINLKRFKNINYIGIIDDEKSYKGTLFCGLKVLGDLESIQEIYEKYKFDEIIITIDEIESDRMDKLNDFKKIKNITIKKMDCNCVKV